MEFEGIDILTALKISEFESNVALTSSSKTDYTNIERSEAFETLGIAQFYNGDYSDAVLNLEKAISNRFINLKSKRRLMIVKSLVDLRRAEQMFTAAADTCKKLHDNIMWSTNLSNLAIVQIRQENAKDALRNARSSMDLMQKVYSKKCFEYLQSVRVMISIFLKLEEFSKAESLVEEHDFPVQEKALLLAGVKFAQSDYAAATTILVKFSKQREADLLQAAASPTVGPAGGNTAALGGGGAADAEKAAAGGGTNTAPITTTAPTPKHSSLIQPVHTYMVDLNYEVMSAMVKYNIAIMKNKNCTDMDISDSIEKLERFNKQIIERRVTVNNKAARVEAVNAKNYEDGVGPMSQDDPYLRLPWDKHPKYMPFDAYMYPAVTLSVMLSAQAENTLLTTPLSQGMAIEAGNISGDVTDMDLTLRQIHHEFKNAHAALHATLPSTAVDTSFSSSVVSAKLLNYKGGWNSEEQFNDDEPGTPHSERVGTPGTGRRTARGVAGLSVDGSTSASASALNSARMEDSAASEDTKHSLGMVTGTEEGQLGDMQEIPDLAEAKYATQRFQLLKDLVTCMIGTEEVAEVAQKRLKEEHRVYVDNETGKILNHREIGNLQNQIVAKSLSKVTKSSHKQQAPSVPGVTGNASTANPGDADVASVAAGASLESKDAQQRATNAAPAITYKASKLSGGTLQSDLLPLVQTFGKDQASLWIEWALSKASSMSFGFLGQSCLDPLPDVGFDLKQKPAPTGPILDSHEDEFLLQVRQRLLDLEITLSNPGENSKVTSVRGVRLESRAINFLLLAKVTVQLKMKKEAGQCILQLEDVCAGLRRQQCDSLDSLVYHSFALRFRMDYEEWCVSAMVSDAWQLSYLVNKMLPLCKQYLAVCNKIGDAVLQRDALKRLINVYSEAGRIAVSDDSDVLLMTTERIQLLTSAELDSYETNIEWVQRNGVNRALLMYEELHKLGTSTRA